VSGRAKVRDIDVRFAFKKVRDIDAPDRSYKIGKIDCAGQLWTIIVDPDLELEGACEYSTNTIRLFEQAPERMLDALVHECLHAIFDNYGIGWQIRQRLKMTKGQWRAFEEDFVVRPLAPALLATFRRAGWLKLPRLIKRRRTRR
jgi:hypothetical protein